MRLQTEVVQKTWAIPGTGELVEFQMEVNEILADISDEDDLISIEFHTMELGGMGVSTAYITYKEYDIEDFEDDDDFDFDDLDEDEDMEDEDMEDEDEEAPTTNEEAPKA